MSDTPKPEEYKTLGISCGWQEEAVDVTYENQATTQCEEGIRHRWSYYCKTQDGDKNGPNYTNWICGQ